LRGGAALGAALGGAFVVGTALRAWNAFMYPTNWGFDAKFNWEYVELLRSSWTLPAPDALWATAHPPLFYYAAALLRIVLGDPAPELAVAAIRSASALAGLGAIALGVWLVARLDPGNRQRLLFAAVLPLFLPVHVYMSAMLNEEVLAAALMSAALVGVGFALAHPAEPARELGRAAVIGAIAGLAWLTKLSGVLVVGAVVLSYALHGARTGGLRPGLERALVAGAVATLIGGWFYARNLIGYGYLYPYALPVHEVMLAMPPGARGVLDYLYVPIATFSDPQLLAPDLLHSVWGSTYVTLWFDGHRFFLPRAGVQGWGTALLLLGLLPTAAFLVGIVGAVRRLVRGPAPVDTPLLLLVFLTLLGYVLFTLRNPWFAAVKGSYLLGLQVPFAYYASEVLARWTRDRPVRTGVVWLGLVALILAVLVVFGFALFFRKAEVPGLVWSPEAGP
jgi:hypothetical protein